MAEFEAPTFSLGLDFGFDSEPRSSTRDDNSTCNPATYSMRNNENLQTFEDVVDDADDEDFGLEVADSEPESGVESSRSLKRLRRGVRVKSESEGKGEFVEVCDDWDDDIDEFSSQEDFRRDELLSTVGSSLCSSTKFFQHGYRVLSAQTTSQSNSRKRKQVSSDPVSTNSEVTMDKIEFPKLTISPLRRFQLLDSDSDDLLYDNVSKSSKVDTFLKGNNSIPCHNTISSEKKKTTTSDTVPQNVDLWKNLSPVKSFCIPTPALDEVCEEYYRSAKEKNVAQKAGSSVTMENVFCENKRSIQNIDLDLNAVDLGPPAHRYFFHEDPRIQNIVRNRLSNFFPLGVPNPRTDITGASVIDYIGQFNHGETTKKQAAQKCDVGGRTSLKGRKNSKNVFTKETFKASGSWVNPKSSTSTPKDAGRRRVHADGQSGGHWYTSSDSKKVYVAKSGQEFTGRRAFMQYKKESGSRFKKSKKKTG